MTSIIRIGSRQSRLAVIQAEIIKTQIERNCPEVRAEIVTMKTTGDRILDKSLETIGGKGLFVKELDKALLAGEIDLAVHSLKDMPMETPDELPILAYGKREDPRDVLILRPGAESEECVKRKGAVIGTSSRRRSVQLQRLYPESCFRGIRGNVQTRLRKLSEEDYDATVLAAAGLLRLGMKEQITRYFSLEEVLPAAGQGILAVQGRAGESYPYLKEVNDRASQAAAMAERAFVRCLGAGCTSPVAAYAQAAGEEIWLQGLYFEEETDYFARDAITGEVSQAERLGEQLAYQMKKEAGR